MIDRLPRRYALIPVVAGAALLIGVAGESAEPGPSVAQAAGEPTLESLRMAKKIRGQRGRVRFLVGVRSDAPVRLTVQIEDLAKKRLVRTVRDTKARPAGRSYLRVDAVTGQGFQLPAGAYRVRVRGRDGKNRLSNELSRNFKIILKAPRGRFDAYTVPRWKGLRRGLPTAGQGQVVAAVAPKGAAVKAGLRKGDVILALNGRRTATPGAMLAARRALPANRAVKVQYRRKGQNAVAQVTMPPDWTKAPPYAASLKVITKREPKVFAWSYALTQVQIDAGQLNAASATMARWPKGWTTSAPGRLLQGNLRLAAGREKEALGSYNQALAKDPAISDASFGKGIVHSRREQHRASSQAFELARSGDARSAPAAAFHAYALLRAGDNQGALEAANRAVALDKFYADAYLPRGIALLALKRKKEGMIALRRGVLDTPDAARADSLIDTYLEPNDP